LNSADHEFMARALQLAGRGIYTTDPNPSVGCVLVAQGHIVGEGYTAPAGGPHAERVALGAAGAAARGATAYVSLEPCSHQGRTGPCAAALIEAGVSRVVMATADPNPLVAGAGARMLIEAGIEVETGLLATAATAINRGFFSRMQRGRPWVRSKVAASLDGRTALANGRSQWITGSAARRDVHHWRARSSVVMTGVGTILADDPSLTARWDAVPTEPLQPLRVIVDSRLRTPPGAKTLSLGGRVLVFAGESDNPAGRALQAAGAELEVVPAAPRCDLAAVLARLGALEANHVWVEAGATLNGALLELGLIDELVCYFAPQLLGDTARGMFAFGPLAELDERIGLDIDDIRMVGRDLRILARPSTVAAR
jgi:diaminohydroxyphosphoribosylaminopyrimidine deaminase/5-amino-6-(5-phosphoribosylamino)uracil reductase